MRGSASNDSYRILTIMGDTKDARSGFGANQVLFNAALDRGTYSPVRVEPVRFRALCA